MIPSFAFDIKDLGLKSRNVVSQASSTKWGYLVTSSETRGSLMYFSKKIFGSTGI
jgi:hypothetical protein